MKTTLLIIGMVGKVILWLLFGLGVLAAVITIVAGLYLAWQSSQRKNPFL